MCIRDRQKHGAVAWFEKPFEARKLLEAVAQHVPATPPSASGGTEEFEVELDIDIEEDEQPDTMELTGKIKVVHGAADGSAELHGADLRARPMERHPDTLVRTRPAGVPPAPPPTKALRRGCLLYTSPSPRD